MSSIRNKFLCAVTAGAAAALGTVVLSAAPAGATPAGNNGLVTYTVQNTSGSSSASPRVVVVDPTTNAKRLLPLPAGMNASRGAVFSPDGSRLAFWANPYPTAGSGWRLFTARPDGSDIRAIDLGPGLPSVTPASLAWWPNGSELLFVADRKLYSVFSNGTSYAFPLDNQPSGELAGNDVTHLSIAKDGAALISLRPTGAGPTQGGRVVLRTYAGVTSVLAADGADAEFDPSGQFAVLRRPAQPGQPLSDWPAVAVNRQGAGVPGSFVPGTPYAQLAPAPDGHGLLYTKYQASTGYQGHCDTLAVQVADTAERQLSTPGDCAVEPAWQPTRKNTVNRVGGRTAVETATAASAELWADKGVADGRLPADAVVLTRNDYYGDGLVGVPLAAAKKGPLLLTDRNSLSASAETEIRRILPAGKTVYLLGDSTALFEPVAARVRALGYNAVWLGGRTQYETAIAIADATNPNPKNILFATGLEYYDALSAGPAAASNDAVVLLTDGNRLPSSVQAYLSRHPNADVFGIGDPAAEALYLDGDRDYYSISGRTAIETATETAKQMFYPPTGAGVATMRSFHDAMSGGAVMASIHAPILLSDPDRLNWATQDYLRGNSASVNYALILGDEGALSSSVYNSVAGEIALPGLAGSDTLRAESGARSLKAPAPGAPATSGPIADLGPAKAGLVAQKPNLPKFPHAG
ncbi:cell wall-binding repeat-containing protein [Embleya sp. NPDC050493]|uniref:cell wall-binding repeat-containing protein n=1 Tax=Embleya sp. NPDC050493 TaxID=3363989 RepID=UPI00379D6C50